MPRDARKGALERLGARRGDQNRRQVASGSGKIEFSSRRALAKHCRIDFSSILVNFRVFCEVCEPLKVLRLPIQNRVRPFALRVESLARRNLEKRRKFVPKSTQNRRKSRLGAARTTFSVDFGRSKRLGRATQGDSERLGERLVGPEAENLTIFGPPRIPRVPGDHRWDTKLANFLVAGAALSILDTKIQRKQNRRN